jgi:hypothetical protein
LFLASCSFAAAQSANQASPSLDSIQSQLQLLANTVSQEATALEASRQQIRQLQQEVNELKVQVLEARVTSSNSQTVALPTPGAPSSEESQTQADPFAPLRAQLEALREQQDVQRSEIAIHEQEKVESASRFPVKLTGLILMNAFVNMGGVDVIQSPQIAVAGSGTTGLSLRQSVLGLDARGPHLFGASAGGDVRVDFFGNVNQSSYTATSGLVRLRTAHSDLVWGSTRAFVELDRPILSPNAPASLTAIVQPALAWSGNLWNWVPQAGVERRIELTGDSHLKLSAALADIPDSPGTSASQTAGVLSSAAEQSRWPASEARIGYSRDNELTGLQIGAGGYFSPHSEGGQFHFDAWAATLDVRLPLFAHLEASGSVYRGAGLGGLGGGAFKDYIYRKYDGSAAIRGLDDVGGWTQLKVRVGERLEFNGALGIDNAFAGELRGALANGSGPYQNLARNATFTTNVIYSPTAYTLFSFEHRRLNSSPVTGAHAISDVYGVAAGYRF